MNVLQTAVTCVTEYIPHAPALAVGPSEWKVSKL